MSLHYRHNEFKSPDMYQELVLFASVEYKTKLIFVRPKPSLEL